MEPSERDDRIAEIIRDLLSGSKTREPGMGGRRLNTARPTEHDSKAKFRIELEMVEGTLKGLDQALHYLIGMNAEDQTHERATIRNNLCKTIAKSARKRSSGKRPKSAHDLIRENILDTDLVSGSAFAMLDLKIELVNRLKDLRFQEKMFWSVKHRPANYYARAIALRLARLYAEATGNRPTFGTAREGGHPATDFGRALERIFGVLAIESSSVKSSAIWAIDQLTDDDLLPPMKGLLGLGGRPNSKEEDLGGRTPWQKAIDTLARSMTERSVT